MTLAAAGTAASGTSHAKAHTRPAAHTRRPGQLLPVLALVAAGCSPVSLAQTELPPTLDSRPTASSSRLAIGANETPSTVTPSAVEHEASIASLQAGAYVVYALSEGALDPEGYPLSALYIVSMEGQIVGRLALGPGDDAAISPDWRRIAFTRPSNPGSIVPLRSLVVMELASGSQSVILQDLDVSDPSWSPDSEGLMVALERELTVLCPQPTEPFVLTACAELGEESHCYHAEWSPDGRWVAYIRKFPQLVDPRDGLYIMDASCIGGTRMCTTASRGPYLLGEDIAWSGNGQWLISGGPPVRIFDIEEGQTDREIELDNPSVVVDSIVSTVTGEWVAVAQGGGIRIVNTVTGGERLLLAEDGLLGVVAWIEVPD